MAIPIIGESNDAAKGPDESNLPTPDFDSLPHASAAAEAHPIHDLERFIELAGHEEPFVRTFAIGHLARAEDDRATAKLVECVADENAGVSDSAIKALIEIDKDDGALEAIAARYAVAEGRLAGECARYLASHDPSRLIELTKKRGRLDDEAFAIVAAELARTDQDDAIAYLNKTMNRAGAMGADRRASLYAAALLSGDPKLTSRVIGLAISDSRSDEPDGGTTPARAALASIAGLQVEAALKKEGENLIRQVRDDESVTVFLEEDLRTRLEEGLKARKLDDALGAFESVLEKSPRDSASAEHISIVKRRNGLLRVLIDRRQQISDLGAGPAGIFLVAAMDAAQMITLSSRPLSESPALITLSKVLETPSEELAQSSVEDLETRFKELTARNVRGVCAPLANESVFDGAVLERYVEALLRAGHGESLIDAASHGRSEGFVRATLKVLGTNAELAEPIIIETLNQRPLEPRGAQLALSAGARLATERVALTVGRRFLELREISRPTLAEAIFRMGDPRLADIIETRAFEGEPEELAWCLLSLIGNAPIEGKLSDALSRIRGGAPRPDELRLPLECTQCGQTLVYGFSSIYVDPKADRPDGDPAFAGEPVCKACGAYDAFKSTPTSIQVMTEAMMQSLASAQAGLPPVSSVLPRTTRITGQETGVAEALRQLNDAVGGSPDSIRMRLRRARVFLLLHRTKAEEDIRAALAIDENSPEAKVLLAGFHAQREDLDEAKSVLIDAYQAMQADNTPRLYEIEADALSAEIGDSLIELEYAGADLPEDLDLTEARHRRADRDRAEAEAIRQLQERMQQQQG